MYDVLDVAKYIIYRCHDRGIIIDNLKLQKVLYFVQAEFLVTKDEPCFDEKIVAWNFGPVIPEVYQEYKIFGSAAIFVGKRFDTRTPIYIAARDKRLINGIADNVISCSNTTLTNIVHCQTPWREAYQQGENTVISLESLKQYFSEE